MKAADPTEREPAPRRAPTARPLVQKACACQEGEACETCGAAPAPAVPRIQRFDADSSIFPGGDTKGFMAQLRSSITEMADAELAEVGRSADNCPYIQRWLAHYDRSDAPHLQRVIQRYASPAEDSAASYHESILSRVRGALRVWKSTGQISGVPEESLAPEPAPAPLSTSLGAGQPLESGIRGRLEAAYGSELGGVRVHAHGNAGAMAQHMSALAFTVGNDIAFAPGMYQPGTPAGDALIAHEVAHTIQQGGVEHPASALDHGTEASLEQEADAAAAGALAGAQGAPAVRPGERGGLKLQRCSLLPDCTRYPQSGLRLDIQRKRDCGLLSPPFLPPDVEPFPDYRWEDDLGNRPLDPACYPVGRRPPPDLLASAGLGGTAALGKLVQRQVPIPLPPIEPLPPMPLPFPLPPIEPLPLPPIELPPIPPIELPPLPPPVPVPPVNPLPIPPTWPGPFPVIPQPSPPQPGPPPEIREDDKRYLDRLTPKQREYYRGLRDAEQLRPAPGEDADDALPDVQPVPEPNTGEDEKNDRGCVAYPTGRRGGHAGHDAYATAKSGTAFDWYARTPAGTAINYDGKTPKTRTVWECKVGHGWFFNCDLAGPREARLRQWDAQKDRGMAVAAACGYVHIWACKDRWVAGILQRRWGGVPPVIT